MNGPNALAHGSSVRASGLGKAQGSSVRASGLGKALTNDMNMVMQTMIDF